MQRRFHQNFTKVSLIAPVTYNRAAVAAWSLYDFAFSAFTTLVVTFIYSTYFTQGIAPDEIRGTELWSRAVAVSAVFVALLSPFLGALADRGGYRKRFLILASLVSMAGSVGLFFIGPGQVWAALAVFVVANIAFEMADVFYNAFLPDIAPLDRIGRISGYGWSAGYVGGLLCLAVALLTLVYPDTPWFGFSKAEGENIRATNLLVAGWWAVFSLPLFLTVRARRREREVLPGTLLRSSFRRTLDTIGHIRRYRQVFRLLLARLIYNDGLVTIFAFGGIYAAGTFGFSFSDIIVFGIALNVAAGAGAFAFGFLDDRFGGKTTILISLAGLSAAIVLAVAATDRTGFWAAGMLIGILAGPNQSASRSLMGRFIPPDRENEFYGFYAFSGKATAFLGPLMLGVLTGVFGSQRIGVASILLFFIIGAVLLLRVDEREGVALAHPAAAPPTE